MSTKDYLKGLAVTLILYRKGSNADKEGEIAEVVTEKDNGDSRYWGGNEDETSLFVTTDNERMHVDFMGTEHEDVCAFWMASPSLCVTERTENTITSSNTN